MKSKDILKKIALILDDTEATDDEKVKAIALWAKPSQKVVEIPTTQQIHEELAQYNLSRPEMRKLQEKVFPFLMSLPRMKSTRYNAYYNYYLPFWIMFKDKGYEDSATAKYVSKLAAKRWPNTTLPNVKGTIRVFAKMAKQLEASKK